jgi:hypothetical protein
MKKLILILLLTVSFSFGQTKISDFEGFWKPTSNTYVNVSFWLDKNNNIQTEKYDTRDGEVLSVLSIKNSGEELTVETLCESTKWYSVSVYSIDKYTKMLKCSTTNILGTYESYYEKTIKQ